MTDYNKVILGGQTLIDLTSDTVTEQTLLVGSTAHKADGSVIEGACTYDSDTTDASAGAAEILNGRSAYINKNRVFGTMPNRGAVSGFIVTAEGQYTIPNGYHDGSGTVKIDDTEKTKIIPENIRQGVTLLGVEGSMTGTEEVVAGSPTVTPSIEQQTILPDSSRGENYLSQVTVEPIPYTETLNAAGGYTISIG